MKREGGLPKDPTPFGRSALEIFSCPMSEDDAARYRKIAEECREQAAKAMSPLDKQAWLRTADEWLELASSVEQRRRQ